MNLRRELIVRRANRDSAKQSHTFAVAQRHLRVTYCVRVVVQKDERRLTKQTSVTKKENSEEE